MYNNPLARKPVDLSAYRNRRVIRPAPEPMPRPRNQKVVALRSRELDAVVFWLMASVAMASIAAGLCINAVMVIAPHTPDMSLESLVVCFSLVFVVLAVRFARKAAKAWKNCDGYDDKLARQREGLASVIRSTERKLPVPFTEWLQ